MGDFPTEPAPPPIQPPSPAPILRGQGHQRRSISPDGGSNVPTVTAGGPGWSSPWTARSAGSTARTRDPLTKATSAAPATARASWITWEIPTTDNETIHVRAAISGRQIRRRPGATTVTGRGRKRLENIQYVRTSQPWKGDLQREPRAINGRPCGLRKRGK